MKKYSYVSAILLLPVICAPGVQAAGNEVSGFIMPTATAVHISGNKAKFSEYGDSDSSISGGVEVEASGETGFVNFTADEIALDNQSYKAETGLFGKFKLDAFYKEIQHNNTFDAISPFSGAGTDQLTSPLSGVRLVTPAPPNPATWETFDFAVSRSQYGAGIRVDLLKPFFANFSVSREDREGIRPIGTGNSNIAAELPEPVDYKTNTMQGEIGFSQGRYFASLGYTLSDFDNAYNALNFTNLYAASGANQNEFVSLPPDNSFNKIDLKARVKMPLKSALAVAYSKAKAESEMDMFGAYTYSGTKYVVVPTDSTFNGRVDTTNYSAVLTTSPLDFLAGKIFYKNYSTDNKSDEITSTITNQTTLAVSTVNPLGLFDYTKKTYGLEADLELPGDVTLTPGYTREAKVLPDNITTNDKIYSINAKWKDAEIMAANFGYERLNREDNTESPNATTNTFAPYTRQYDIASQRRDTYKLGVDVFPSEKLDLGFTVKHQRIKYDETAIGLTGKVDDNYGVSVNFTPNATVSISAYADYELTTLEMLNRYAATGANISPVDINPGDGSFNITTTQKDKSLDWGLGVSVIAIPKKLTLAAQYDHTRSDGNADYNYGPNNVANSGIPNGWNNGSIDFANWDDYKKDALSLKATLSLSAHLDLIGGYAYEYYRYTDGQYENFKYIYGTSATQANYLSGANADPDYTANVVFLSAKYKF